jgi:nitrogen fixation/metabolism regulation signal transduction histidine kinase
MEGVLKLDKAFKSFAEASESLTRYYNLLRDRVEYLTRELEKKNEELRQAVSEISRARDYLHTIIQSIGEAIVVLDIEERVTLFNQAAEKILRISDKDKGKRFQDLGFKITETERGTLLTINDKKYEVMISKSEITGQGNKIHGYVILIKDITRIRELERQYERNKRLIAMGEMAAKIVHEIRSPLCSIELFSSMLLDDLRDTPYSEMAQGISAGIKSLNNILTNMLLFARPQKPLFKDIDIVDVIEETITILKPMLEIRGVKVNTPNKETIIKGDGELLKQVFMNIIINAAQAMPEGGEVRIEVGSERDIVTVSISDEGIGIKEQDLERIFDPFYSTKDKGTGLGLAIAHKIMQEHGGYIKAFRNKERGSTFKLYFPCHEISNPQKPTKPSIEGCVYHEV